MSRDSDLSEDLRSSLDRHRDRQTASGNLVLSDDQGHVGDEITLRGRNLPAATDLEVVWHGIDGEWGVLEANQVLSPQYQPTTDVLGTVRTDESGAFDEPLVVPEDYGSVHTVELRADDGSTLAEAEFEVRPWFELLNDTAPMGDFFTVKGYGIGPDPTRNNYQLAWDNGTVGFMTGVKNNGTATARVRAVGPPGEHGLRVWRSYRGLPFLQGNTQSAVGPVGGDRQCAWRVEVTEPETRPDPAWTEAQIDERPIELHYPELDRHTDAELEITPKSGTPGTTAFVRGEQFPPDETVDLVWHRHAGKRIEGASITPQRRPDKLPTVETDAEGSFEVEVEIPIDRGSSRPITAEVGGESVAITGFMLQPEVLEFTPERGPDGTEIDIKIAGIGWTLYENAHFLVYDNKLLGYACGNCDDGEEGVVHINLRASGRPGLHFLDVYPTIFQTEDEGTGFECKPHLSYLDNHPVRPLPAHHFAFEITE